MSAYVPYPDTVVPRQHDRHISCESVGGGTGSNVPRCGPVKSTSGPLLLSPLKWVNSKKERGGHEEQEAKQRALVDLTSVILPLRHHVSDESNQDE